ncbi:hypothetical protein SAMN05428966_10264 [Massilia sp. PDC64]|nr:hypothetical protein [Massilia sp. PDC64]SDC66228.1 hypothetical protein SAMN05428966_10264 [Massilia sp. PDC64]
MNDNPENPELTRRAVDEMRLHPEQQLRQMLVDLHREYQRQTAPIIKALARYEALRPPRPLIIPMLPDDHPLVASTREAAERAMHDGMAAYKLVVKPAAQDGEAPTISAEVVRAVDMDASEEQHACAKSLDSRKSQQ